MSIPVELDPEVYERLESHCDEGETVEEFITELINMYESEGRFLQEGYSE